MYGDEPNAYAIESPTRRRSRDRSQRLRRRSCGVGASRTPGQAGTVVSTMRLRSLYASRAIAVESTAFAIDSLVRRGRATPFSVMIAVISSAGVTSKAGL